MPIIYVDFTSQTGLLTGIWTFTNASATVSGSGGAALTELAVGNYVRVSTGVQWYKVVTVPTDNSFTITPVFQQVTVTDAANATKKNANDGSSTVNAFCHLNQATTDTVRSAGDIIKVRANQTHTYRTIPITIDESGDWNNKITLKGCDISDDPWGDGSSVKPILDFVSTNAGIDFSVKNFWSVQNLDFYRTNTSNGAIYLTVSAGFFIYNCIFRNGYLGLRTSTASDIVVQNCTFYTNNAANMQISNSFNLKIKDCILYGVGGYGIDIQMSDIEIYDTTLGIPTAHSVADIYFNNRPSYIKCRNVTLGSPNQITGITNILSSGSFVKIEDYAQTKLAQNAQYDYGNTERGTSDIGGVTHWLKGTPNSHCGLEQTLVLFEDLSIWLPASQKTITVSMYASGWGVSLPSNAECYIELKYWDTASTKRGAATSIQAFAANDTWTNFSVTITPNSEGPAYLSAFLKKYIASALVYVNIATLPTIT